MVEFGTKAGAMSDKVDVYQVIDMTTGSISAKSQAGTRSYRGKCHSFDNERAAKSRKTLLSNRHKARTFRILHLVILEDGAVGVEWLPE